MFRRASCLALVILIAAGPLYCSPCAYAEKSAAGSESADSAAAATPEKSEFSGVPLTKKGMVSWDWIVIALYFGVLLVVVWWVVRGQKDSSADYFLAGRNAGWFIIGASLFASNIGSEHLVGLAGTGAKDGVAMAHYELHAWCLLVLGWLLVPFYARTCVFTMPEFLERRYTPAARWFLSVVSLIAYVFTKVAVTLFAGGIVFKTLFPDDFIPGIDNFWLGAVGIVVITGVYTVLGGLRAVLYTDALQTVVLILGSVFVIVIGLYYLGGWDRLYELTQRPQEGLDHFNLWKPLDNPQYEWWENPNFPWLGILIGAPIVGLWYWCTDQYIVQRTLAARDQTQARRGAIFGSYLKLSPVFLFIIPGMIAFALWKDGQLQGLEKIEEDKNRKQWAFIEKENPETHKLTTEKIEAAKVREMIAGGDPKLRNVAIRGNQAYPLMVRDLLPAGIRGLVVGALLAALMSSLSSVFNSCSTLFTMDIYKKLHPGASEHTLVWVGRMTTATMVVLGLIWIPFISLMSDTLYVYLQSVQAYIAPPIFAVFFLGIFWKRINGPGCMAALVGGFFLGMGRLVTELMKKSVDKVDGYLHGNQFYEDMFARGTFWNYFAGMNFLYFCIFLLLASMALLIGVSLLTAKPSEEQLKGLTFTTLSRNDKEQTRSSWNFWDVFHTCVVLGLILAAYLYFIG